MPFEFIEIEDNFLCEPATDPYRRKHIRTRYTLQNGESMADAENTVHQYIKEYIEKNTFYPEHAHIEEKYIVNASPLPEIQVEKKSVLNYGDQIRASLTVEELKEFKIIADMNPKLTAIYNETLKILTNE